MDNSQNNDLQDTVAMAANTGALAADERASSAERALEAGQEAAQRGADAVFTGAEQVGEKTEQAAGRAAAGFNTFAAEWLESTRSLAERTVERMSAIANARNVVDLIGAQRDLMVGSFQDILAVQQRIGSASMDAMTANARRAPSPLVA